MKKSILVFFFTMISFLGYSIRPVNSLAPPSGGSCTATAKCFDGAGNEIGSISCTGEYGCGVDSGSVECEGVEYTC